MIPKLIHQTAKTSEIPKNCIPYQRKLIQLHSDWKYHLWTDEDNIKFVREEFPQFVDVFIRLPKNIMRADVIRYLLLYRLGGLYLDTDYEMLKPYDLLNHGAVLPWETDNETTPGERRIANSLMAAEPGHPFFKMVIDDLQNNPPLNPDVDVLYTTGPFFLTRIMEQAFKEGVDIYCPAKPLFNPPAPPNARKHREMIRKGEAYGIHYCFGSWRDFSLPRRIKHRIGSLIRAAIS
jgi:inositol phosphorylceramide mannosyltransferase catalytic subunit